MQDNDNSGLNKIIDIIAKESGLSFTPSKCNEIALIPPVALLLQLIEMLMASTGNIIGSFTNIGVDFDPYFLLENYIPHMDWNRFKKAADHKKNKQSVTDSIEGIKNGGSGGPPGGGGFGG